MKITLTFAAALLLVASLACSAHAKTEKGPLRVFVLVGQSNMQGKGKIQHLEQLIADDATAADYKHLKRRRRVDRT